ncbi:hypothetical protein BGZ49_002004 [Haplosporangium sp. Z 27]|nr:hypothetical protein BGZ49_002004 [Haplosporangium sp. Z 27]
MSTTTPLHPLLLSEIVIHLGRFIPIWGTPWPNRDDQCFKPKTLLACLLVCRTWNSALHPLLWYAYLGRIEIFQRIPLEILSKNAQHIRVFKAGPDFDTALYLPNLIELSLRRSKYYSHGEDYSDDSPIYKMIKLNSHIQKLCWLGDNGDHPNYIECLMGITNLKSLELVSWRGSLGALKSVLEGFSGILTCLRLYGITGLGSTAIETLSLPCVTSLGIYLDSLPDVGLGKLLGCCPNLIELAVSFDRRVFDDFYYQQQQQLDLEQHQQLLQSSVLADWIRSSSPASLTSLNFSTSFSSAFEVMEIIRSIRTLESFDYCGGLNSAIVKTIVECHGPYFKVLRCHTLYNDRVEARALAVLLESCPRLESLFIDCKNPISDDDLFTRLIEHPWACLSLKDLYLSTVKATAAYEDEMVEPPSSSYIGFGWYNHAQRNPSTDVISHAKLTKFLRQLFEHLQGLPMLKTFYLNNVQYSRSSIPLEM